MAFVSVELAEGCAFAVEGLFEVVVVEFALDGCGAVVGVLGGQVGVDVG